MLAGMSQMSAVQKRARSAVVPYLIGAVAVVVGLVGAISNGSNAAQANRMHALAESLAGTAFDAPSTGHYYVLMTVFIALAIVGAGFVVFWFVRDARRA